MNFYCFLASLGYLKSYKSKIMAVAFVGTHIPLLALLFYFFSTADIVLAAKFQILGIALLATLIGTAATLLALHKLLAPVSATAQAIRDYWDKKLLPTLPTQYTDDAGVLMANTTQTLRQLDTFIIQLEDCDELTGLPNRKAFKSSLLKEISTIEAQQKITLYLIDIDEFQLLNAIEGDDTGSQILCAIAQRLAQYMNGENCVARLGNDEFALFKTSDRALVDGGSTALELLALLYQVGKEISDKLHLTASIGISVYPTDGQDPEQLITNTYIALQRAKQAGNNCYRFYSTELAHALQERLELANDLRYAIERNQLSLHYQPRIDWRSRKMVAVECLLRWQHPELGEVSPAEFIPIAEATGLIFPIGEWVLKTACQQNKSWQQAGLPSFTVAVNLSARQVEQAELVDFVQLVLDETGLAAQFLELEVTESLLIGNIARALSVLEALHAKGIALALDDFGTGYSSLSYLRKFPFDILKIDRAFVQDMVSSSDAAEVTRAIVALAKGLQMGLIAEGVETDTQLSQIKSYGCYEIQGNYFSPPLPATELSEFVKQLSAE